jgi:hypothetical protein
MSEVKVNKLSPRTNCGTVTLGDSGDTFTIPSGVTITNNGTQTGFGRTGTVDWDTTKKTAAFTAVSGNGYFVDTTSAAITVTLPASPSAGDIVAVMDYANTASTNNITVARNSSKINGTDFDATIQVDGESYTLIYVDATEGWKTVNNANQQIPTAAYVAATGGTVTTCGDFKIHTFTGPGNFCVSCAGNAQGSNKIDYLVIAGGGGGGTQPSGHAFANGGGGGAGGYRESGGGSSGCYSIGLPANSCVSGITATASCFPITVGGGGAGGTAPSTPRRGCNGSNSVFSTITSAGGGGGGAEGNQAGLAGGSGGGSGGAWVGPPGTPNPSFKGAGNTPPVTPPQGEPGGHGQSLPGNPSMAGAGGGGASAEGGSYPSLAGGAGATSCITASPVARAGGGGGSCGGAGGSGGGGSANGNAGTTNTGGGGGGNRANGVGGAGGSGIVILRYKFQ